VHGQGTDLDHRRARAGTGEPALGQLGLRRDTRHRPAVIGACLDHDLGPVGQPETDHHRHPLELEQHVGGFATQML
jgi:hypothetical protein